MDDGQPPGTASTEGARSTTRPPSVSAEGLLVVAGATAEDHATAEQGNAAEQHGQREEARDRLPAAAAAAAGLDLARLLHVVAALVLFAEHVSGRLVVVLLDAGVLAGQALDGESGAGGAEHHAGHEHDQDRQA